MLLMWRVCNSQLSEDCDVRVKQCTVDMKKRAWSVGRWSQDFTCRQARVTLVVGGKRDLTLYGG